MEFRNKTAIITGGASGIGFLTAKCMAKEGANVKKDLKVIKKLATISLLRYYI